MSAVKIFFSYRHEELNAELQGWLAQGGITVLDVSMDSNQHGHCLAVLYGPDAGAQYEGQVLFAWRHDELESEANTALRAARTGDGAQFVALGSNEHGHCLCVIRQTE